MQRINTIEISDSEFLVMIESNIIEENLKELNISEANLVSGAIRITKANDGMWLLADTNDGYFVLYSKHQNLISAIEVGKIDYAETSNFIGLKQGKWTIASKKGKELIYVEKEGKKISFVQRRKIDYWVEGIKTWKL